MISFTRFFFGLPIVIIAYTYIVYSEANLEINSNYFYVWIFVFAVFQVAATAFLISLFNYKNFAVSVSYTKSETLFVAILGTIILSEQISNIGIAGILISFSGIMFSTLAKGELKLKNIINSFNQKSTYIGFLSGLMFAIALVAIKLSFNYLDTDSKLNKSIFSLFAALIIQSGLMLIYMLFKRKKELIYILENPRLPLLIGLFSSLGSFFWFVAFSMASIAYVRTFGQLEFVLSVLISVHLFKENVTKNEL